MRKRYVTIMSSFVFEGIIIAQGETQSGQSQDGKKWMKVLYTIQEDQDKYPMKMVFDIFGEERLRKFALRQGERVRLRFRIDTEEYKGREYNKIYVMDVDRAEAPRPAEQTQKRHTVVQERLPWEK